jgi:2-oxoglutarate dehydrogenase E2 component (dihydrolipoamide succinyltransferase)
MTAIKVPPLGESIVEATVSRWFKQVGEAIAAGDTLVELETDKITVEVPALKAGVLTRRAREEGDVVKVDEVLGEIDENAATGAKPASGAKPAPAAQQPAASGARAASAAASQREAQGPSGAARQESAAQGASPGAAQRTGQSGAPRDGTAKVSPAAQRAAAEAGIDVSKIEGTGRGGVVGKPDVVEEAARGWQARESEAPDQEAPDQEAPDQEAPDQEAAEQGASEQEARPAQSADAPQRASASSSPPAPPAPPAPRAPRPSGNGARETREKMSTRRKRIAENLLRSKQETASLTTFNEIDMTTVSELRERTRDAIQKKHDVKLTYMPFFVKACCMALKDFPNINAQVDGDSILYKHYVHMGIAVASEQGLVVPTIKDADRKNMVELSADIVSIAKRARDGKLTMDDLTGGTFTITNGGVFGSLLSTPILNHPQVGILGLHKIEDRPVAVDAQVVVRPMMYVALTYDHRIVDGQHSVQFLVRVKELMEDPARMLLD